MVVSRKELAEKVVAQYPRGGKEVVITAKVVEDILKYAESGIADELKENNTVQLTGFGTFSVSERAARMGRNPQTGATVEIPAKTTPKFKPGKTFKDNIC